MGPTVKLFLTFPNSPYALCDELRKRAVEKKAN
jgi:hypothetical protein